MSKLAVLVAINFLILFRSYLKNCVQQMPVNSDRYRINCPSDLMFLNIVNPRFMLTILMSFMQSIFRMSSLLLQKLSMIAVNRLSWTLEIGIVLDQDSLHCFLIVTALEI